MKLHIAVLLYAFASTQIPQAATPALTADALSSDRVAIYREFLASKPALAEASPLNVSIVTEPFLYKNYVDPDRSCLVSAHIFELSTPQLHKLPAEAFASDRVHLIDIYAISPAAPPPGHNVGLKTLSMFHRAASATSLPARPDSLLRLSEIVFDESHTHAALRYNYSSTQDSGKGATVVYALDHGIWKALKATCSEWVR